MTEILKPPTNYTGSKHNLILELLKYFPSKEDVSTFYDVFCGGLSVSMNVDYDKIIANDTISPLIDFYTMLKYSADNGDIEKEIKSIQSYAIDKTSQDQFNEVRKEFNKTKSNPYLFFALVNSCTNNMMRFNKKGEFNQTFGKRTINDNTLDKVLKYMNRMRDKDITFTNQSFDNLLSTNKPSKGDFVYLDPPYWISEAGYNAVWDKKSESRLYDIMDEMNSNGVKFLMSNVSEHKGIVTPYIDRMKKWNMVEVNYDYEKVARKKEKGITKEVMIMNF